MQLQLRRKYKYPNPISEPNTIANSPQSMWRLVNCNLLAKLSPIPPEIIFQECIWYSGVVRAGYIIRL